MFHDRTEQEHEFVGRGQGNLRRHFRIGECHPVGPIDPIVRGLNSMGHIGFALNVEAQSARYRATGVRQSGLAANTDCHGQAREECAPIDVGAVRARQGGSAAVAKTPGV